MKNTAGTLVRLAFAALGLIAAARRLSAQDFTIHMKMDDGSDGTTYYVSPDAIRRVTPGATDVIDRIDRGTIIYLDHRTKTYKEGSVAEAHDAIARAMDSTNLDPQRQAMLH